MSSKQKITMSLTPDLIKYLKAYSLDVLRTGSISEAVRVIVKEHEEKNKEQSI